MFEVANDPLELWSNAESETRKHKEYFDSHFRPFFRTEQVIMYPKDESQFSAVIENETMELGPIFRKKFLLEVFKLHNAIKNVNQSFRWVIGSLDREEDDTFLILGKNI